MNNTSSLHNDSPLFYDINRPLSFPSTYMISNIQIVDIVEYSINNLLPLLDAVLNW